MKESETVMKNQDLISFCDKLRSRYPEYISLEQFRIVCQIAKRTASYLLTNGIVPCIDTGKKTCRYRIKIEDVIAYLHRVDTINNERTTSTINCKTVYPTVLRKTYAASILSIPEVTLIKFLEDKYSHCPDVMTSSEMAEITGLNANTILTYIKRGAITAFKINRLHMIPKPYAFKFIISRQFIESISSAMYVLGFNSELDEWCEKNRKGKIRKQTKLH